MTLYFTLIAKKSQVSGHVVGFIYVEVEHFILTVGIFLLTVPWDSA